MGESQRDGDRKQSTGKGTLEMRKGGGKERERILDFLYVWKKEEEESFGFKGAIFIVRW